MTKTEHKTRKPKSASKHHTKGALKAPKKTAKPSQQKDAAVAVQMIRPEKQLFRPHVNVDIVSKDGRRRSFRTLSVAGIIAGLNACGIPTDKGVVLRADDETGVRIFPGSTVDNKWLAHTHFTVCI